MSEELYQQAIKELARAAHGAGRLSQPTASVRCDNALCGDRVTLDLRIEAGIIVGVAHETRGCLLCRASASLLAQEVPGWHLDDVEAAHTALKALLQGTAAEPCVWPALSIFAPVRPHKSRHDCVLLAFRAMCQAVKDASQAGVPQTTFVPRHQ